MSFESILQAIIPLVKDYGFKKVMDYYDDFVNKVNNFFITFYIFNIISVIAITLLCFSGISLFALAATYFVGVMISVKLFNLFLIISSIVFLLSAIAVVTSYKKIIGNHRKLNMDNIPQSFDHIENIISRYAENEEHKREKKALENRIQTLEGALTSLAEAVNGMNNDDVRTDSAENSVKNLKEVRR